MPHRRIELAHRRTHCDLPKKTVVTTPECRLPQMEAGMLVLLYRSISLSLCRYLVLRSASAVRGGQSPFACTAAHRRMCMLATMGKVTKRPASQMAKRPARKVAKRPASREPWTMLRQEKYRQVDDSTPRKIASAFKMESAEFNRTNPSLDGGTPRRLARQHSFEGVTFIFKCEHCDCLSVRREPNFDPRRIAFLCPVLACNHRQFLHEVPPIQVQWQLIPEPGEPILLR